MARLIIQGKLDGLNEYTSANRANRYKGSTMKNNNERAVIYAIRQAKLSRIYKYPIHLKIAWYEPNKRRDIDNITFATKFILDALVKTKIIADDSQKYVDKIEHEILVDKNNPRIVVELLER